MWQWTQTRECYPLGSLLSIFQPLDRILKHRMITTPRRLQHSHRLREAIQNRIASHFNHPWTVTMPPSFRSHSRHQVLCFSQNALPQSSRRSKPFWPGTWDSESEQALQRVMVMHRQQIVRSGSPWDLSPPTKFSDWSPAPQPVPLASLFRTPPRFFTLSTLELNWSVMCYQFMVFYLSALKACAFICYVFCWVLIIKE